MEADIISHLIADGSVSGIVADEIYPSIAPQGTAAPYLVIHRVTTRGFRATSGTTGLDKARLQVECYGNSYAEAKSLASAVRGALDGAAITNISLCQFETEHDDFNEGSEIFRTITEFYTWA